MRFLVILASAIVAFAAERVDIDFTARVGDFKPLNGVNKGPVAPGGLLDVSPDFTQLRIPFVRLHDCHWPNPDVVDIHVVFPRPEADPRDPASYDFALTDEYIDAIKRCGAQPIYRLGESIEHTREKRFVHPPKDPERWAQICLGIIRHYPQIQYWEIWNEPENRPVMWTGNDDQFIELYRVTSRAIKAVFPNLKIGGPALGASGSVRNGVFTPTEFLRRFLETCRAERLPLDFFSWHCYTTDPSELVIRARAVRNLLNEYGFNRTESHLNEWNYLPDNSWKPIMRGAAPTEREAYYQRMGGREGAAFACAAMILLQDSPLDLAAFFHGEVGGFGLFNEFGVPNETFAAFKAYGDLLRGSRVSASGSVPVAASAKSDECIVLLANAEKVPRNVDLSCRLPFGVWRLSAEKIQPKTSIELPAHSFRLLRFSKE